MTNPDRPPVSSRSRSLLAKAVTVYGVLALLACLGLGIVWGQERSALARTAKDETIRLSTLASQADQAEAAHRALEEEQAANRGSYTPPEAVAMSMKVQAAQVEVRRNQDAERIAQAKVEAAEEKVRVRSLRFVPLIAVAAAHFLLLVLIALANPRQAAA